MARHSTHWPRKRTTAQRETPQPSIRNRDRNHNGNGNGGHDSLNSADDRYRCQEVLFEMTRNGPYAVNVVAIDPATKTEVSMIGDVRVGTERLKEIATLKLEYVINKNR